jgi:hypothetical protein
VLDLCDVLGVPRPDPSTGDPDKDLYTFERDAPAVHEGEKVTTRKMDLYKEGCFVLEAKQGSDQGSRKSGTARRGTPLWENAMQEALSQARGYARTLPAPPPFLIVCDIGHCFDLYAVFDGSADHRPFRDAVHNRIFLGDIEKHLPLFRALFTDPLSLDPSRRSAAVTREVAARLAELAKELHEEKHSPEQVARFLMRCIFTMFVEDVGLLPERLFSDHLEKKWIPHAETFPADIEQLWQMMNKGGWVFGIGDVLQFNGGLFAAPTGLPLKKEHLTLLLEAARSNWADVEPAIFGTLLERALDPVERHALGAHFTPRAYVERLVKPTIEEPMREEWDTARTAAHLLVEAGKPDEAIKLVRDFHHRLCHTRVFDPACGSGNFLYVTLDLFKRLESEVLALLKALGDKTDFLNIEGLSVTPEQFLGIEIKRWAKEIAELVLWIGYLQWHYRTHGKTPPREPVLHDYRNIECRDAVLSWDGEPELVCDPGTAKPLTRWDGRTYKKSPVTGEDVPDESARVPLYRYANPRKAEWPEAEFVVGNPPFIGNKRMRLALGDGYVEALREAHSDVPDSADYVMYWWNHAANLLRAGKLRRFGLITTNSITQTYNRSILETHMSGKDAISLSFAVPDHPWVDTEEGAAVRVGMTVGVRGPGAGLLIEVTSEADDEVTLRQRHGVINADLSVGVNIVGVTRLRSNLGLAFRGVTLVGPGFVVSAEQAETLGRSRVPSYQRLIRPLRNGRDFTDRPRRVFALDLFGMSLVDVQKDAPELYQWLLDRVKPMRDQVERASYRELWWIFAEPRRTFRSAATGLGRFIASVMTASHRVFHFVSSDVLCDQGLITIADDDAFTLAVLSSHVHICWSLGAGGRLGYGNDPRYNNSRCFDPFPFPVCSEELKSRIRALGESLDAHRKRQQSLHPDLMITGMYNVLTKLRSGEALSAKEKVIHEQGLVSVLKQIHDDLDAAVFDAYGWPHDLTDEQILERLVALNRERAEEEKAGVIRWLRPEFQAPRGAASATQVALAGTEAGEVEPEVAPAAEVAWPKKLPAQIAAVRDLFRGTNRALTFDDVLHAFKGAKKKDAEAVLESLTALGLLRVFDSDGQTRWRAEVRIAA